VIQCDVTILFKFGLHLRPASKLATTAAGFKSLVRLRYNGCEERADHLLGIVKLAIKTQSQVTLIVEGSDEEEAMVVLIKLFKDGDEHK
jgi:phosphotransferase system HPr (HPr) family protein